MADHPFANSGLGMYGAAENMYAKSAMQGDGKNGSLGKALGSLLGATGLEEFLNEIFSGNETPASPVGSIAPTNSISQQGINPMRLPDAVPGGIGLNAKPAGAVNPFQFQTTPVPQLTPDEEYRNQIKSAWS
jgi:hypothetical protein